MRLAPALSILTFGTAAACGGQSSPSSAPPSGNGEFYVQSYVPTAGSSVGASYLRKVTFTSSTCSSMHVGTCSVDPCSGTAADAGSAPLPTVGSVTIDGAQMPPLTLVPESDGAYAQDTTDGQLAWTTGGSTVTFQWAHLPGNAAQAGGSFSLSTPPYIALTAESTFSARNSVVLDRTMDVPLSWTSDSAPTEADQVAVDIDDGASQLVCIFSVSAGSAVIPSAAMKLLAAGPGKFNVHSKQGNALEHVDGTQWTLGFNVDAQARTSYGMASGQVTLE